MNRAMVMPRVAKTNSISGVTGVSSLKVQRPV
jgi:hypothetical protein